MYLPCSPLILRKGVNMSLLVEMWSEKNVDPVTRWPFCRTYKSLDNPMMAKVTRIITDPGTNTKREVTLKEYVVSPLDIRQRKKDKEFAKTLVVIFLILGATTAVFLAIYRYRKPTIL